MEGFMLIYYSAGAKEQEGKEVEDRD